MTTYKFTLPIPPTVNQMYKPVKFAGRAGIAHTPKAKEYKLKAPVLIRNSCKFEQVNKAKSGKLEDQPRCHVTVHLYPPTRGRRDVDGIAKMLLDAIQDCKMIYDDSQVDCLLIKKCAPDKDNPRIEVKVQIYD